VLRLTGTGGDDLCDRPGPLRAGLASITCLLRGLPLLFSATPRTPLRVLCIVALDTIHLLRFSRPLSRRRRNQLAAFLDFEACTNAMWDRKPLCMADYQGLQQRLEDAGLGSWIVDYLLRIRELETRRPPVGGDRRCFDAVRAYREAVARLSLATVAAIALDAECLDDGVRLMHDDVDVGALFRMSMQCQVIDDIVDYEEDLSVGLPSFLTAAASLPDALALTAEAAHSYGASRGHPTGRSVFPLELALYLVTAVSKVVIALAPSRGGDHRASVIFRSPS
jgi:hypothetical protein